MWSLKLTKAAAAMAVVLPGTVGFYITGRKTHFPKLTLPTKHNILGLVCSPVHALKKDDPNARPCGGGMKGAKKKATTTSNPQVAAVPTAIRQPTVPEESKLGIELPKPSGNLIRQQPDNTLTISYNRHNKQANWVLEDITCESIQGCLEGTKPMKVDPNVKPQFQTRRDDYTMTYGKYEMAQLAAAANHVANPNALKETYFMSNIVPMDPKLKSDTWEFLEQHIRCEYVARHKNTFIITGPLYKTASRYAQHVDYELISSKGIPVPTDFFKIVGYRTEDDQCQYVCFVFPNQPTVICCPEDLDLFRVNLHQIDLMSGFDFSTVFKQFKEEDWFDPCRCPSPCCEAPCGEPAACPPPCCPPPCVKPEPKRICPRPPGLEIH